MEWGPETKPRGFKFDTRANSRFHATRAEASYSGKRAECLYPDREQRPECPRTGELRLSGWSGPLCPTFPAVGGRRPPERIQRSLHSSGFKPYNSVLGNQRRNARKIPDVPRQVRAFLPTD